VNVEGAKSGILASQQLPRELLMFFATSRGIDIVLASGHHNRDSTFRSTSKNNASST
jgi:hypothetical protein